MRTHRLNHLTNLTAGFIHQQARQYGRRIEYCGEEYGREEFRRFKSNIVEEEFGRIFYNIGENNILENNKM